MKLLFFAALFCCICATLADIDLKRADALFDKVKDTPIVKSDPAKVEKVRKKVFVKGCGVNICFALDGSKSLKDFGDNFQTQKDFVNLIGAIVGADKNSNFAGTVYGFVNDNISKLTPSAEKFLLQVNAAPFPAAPVTFISAGLGFCFNELDNFEQRNDVNKIVLLGDGFSTFGDLTGPLAPVSIAKQWRDLGDNYAMCAVAVGFPSIRSLAAIVGDPALVLEVTEWPKLLDILDSLVDSICFREVKPHPVTPKPHTTKPHTTKPHTTKPHIRPCPCKCYLGHKAFKKANKKCNKSYYSHCKVSSCGHHGYHCCKH